MNATGFKEELYGPLLRIRAGRRILPGENGKSGRPKGVGILSADPDTTVIALFGSQTGSTTIDESGGFI